MLAALAGRIYDDAPQQNADPLASRNMSLESEFHDAMEDLYQKAGLATRYWGNRFLQAVRKHGGVAWARQTLKPRKSGEYSGLKALVRSGRLDLSLEAQVLNPKFSSLFSDAELAEAQKRFDSYQAESLLALKSREGLLPEEFTPDEAFPVGFAKRVQVNAYERDPLARAACIAAHGTKCKVCAFDFAERYGEIGKQFIHVHHVTPISRLAAGYSINPKVDLVPVCPNCHAMLHRTDPPLSCSMLRKLIRRAAG